MSHTPHEIAAEFPDKHDVIHRLKTSDAHFARLAEEYHELNRQIHRAESEVEPTSDEILESMKKKRLKLLDTLAGIIHAA